ncbi:DUF3219 family protein [bacterium LRH843]|nr:DUF3219 family protein [bacterium LRH843]
MTNELYLDDSLIKIKSYKEEKVNGLYKISVDFEVTSEEYHEVTTLLYKGTFDVKVPEKNVTFRGTIQQYSTSIINLYVKGQVGDFKLSLLEVKN